MQEQRENGIVIGLVIDLDDPERLGRVRVKYPHLNDQVSTWARLVAPMAGPGRGVFFRPEVNDEVLIAFEHGDPRRPYILGALWSSVDMPPPDDGHATQNNWRFIKSRSGHIVKLDDTQGAEKIEIVDKDGSRKVVIDSANRQINITCDDRDVNITASNGTVTISAMSIDVHATTDLTLEAPSGTVTITGAMVNIN